MMENCNCRAIEANRFFMFSLATVAVVVRMLVAVMTGRIVAMMVMTMMTMVMMILMIRRMRMKVMLMLVMMMMMMRLSMLQTRVPVQGDCCSRGR